MKIVCPECESGFDVPMALIGPEGRRVRCATCSHVWHTGGTVPDLPPVPSPYAPPANPISATAFEIDFDINRRPTASDTPSFQDMVRDGMPKKGAKIATPPKKTMLAACLTFALIMGAFVALRGPLVTIMPTSAAIYNGFGLKTKIPAEGAAIDRLVLRPVRSGKELKIELSTKLLNLTEKQVTLSKILVEQIDAQGKPMGPSWKFEPTKSSLRAGETVPFTQTVGPLKGEAETVQLRARYIN